MAVSNRALFSGRKHARVRDRIGAGCQWPGAALSARQGSRIAANGAARRLRFIAYLAGGWGRYHVQI